MPVLKDTKKYWNLLRASSEPEAEFSKLQTSPSVYQPWQQVIECCPNETESPWFWGKTSDCKKLKPMRKVWTKTSHRLNKEAQLVIHGLVTVPLDHKKQVLSPDQESVDWRPRSNYLNWTKMTFLFLSSLIGFLKAQKGIWIILQKP